MESRLMIHLDPYIGGLSFVSVIEKPVNGEKEELIERKG